MLQNPFVFIYRQFFLLIKWSDRMISWWIYKVKVLDDPLNPLLKTSLDPFYKHIATHTHTHTSLICCYRTVSIKLTRYIIDVHIYPEYDIRNNYPKVFWKVLEWMKIVNGIFVFWTVLKIKYTMYSLTFIVVLEIKVISLMFF